MRKPKAEIKKSKCGKSTFPDKETSDKYIEIKREKIGSKFQELRSYKCLECKLWHHTSNLTPIYKKMVADLKIEIEGLKNELRIKTQTLETILASIYKILPNKANKQKEIIELKALLKEKNNLVKEFKISLATALVELSKYK